MASVSDAIQPMQGFSFGCDPEVFILDAEGLPVSPVPFIPGTKEEPYKVKYGAVQRDGMAAEFNIDPAYTFHDFNRNINAVMNQMKKMIPKDHTFGIVPSVVFSQSVWDATPDDAKELGCSPDFNAWDGFLNPPPMPQVPTARCAGGHLHIGWTENAAMDDVQHIVNCRDLVKQLDWYLGGWSVSQDKDHFRRSLYGRAGACRYKPYGVEYRVLSNFWLKSPKLRLETWNRMQSAIHAMATLFLPERGSFLNSRLQDSINRSKMDRKFAGINFPFHKYRPEENTWF